MSPMRRFSTILLAVTATALSVTTAATAGPAQALEHAGYRGIWHPQRAHHGVAVLARGEMPREVGRVEEVARAVVGDGEAGVDVAGVAGGDDGRGRARGL